MTPEQRKGTEYWRKGDPRIEINKRADIVIVRPGINGREAGMAQVETHQGWYIFTDFEGYKGIDDWPEDWWWTFAPEKQT